MASRLRIDRLRIDRLRIDRLGLLCVPAAAFITAFLLYPLAKLILTSFTGAAGLMQYERLVATPLYGQVLQRTLVTSGATAVICAVLAYPIAYRIATAGPRGRAVLLGVVLVPFWTNLLVRSYGWMILLNPKGVLNAGLAWAGLTPVPMVYNQAGVLVGMVHIMLPYMVLTLAAVMARIDQASVRAARSLGASPACAFLQVYLPQTSPGLAAGLLLVFTISLGFFVIPAMLGGPRDLMLAQLIEFNINTSLNWPMAAALSTVLLVTTLGLYHAGAALVGHGRDLGRGRVRAAYEGVVWLIGLFLLLPTLIVVPMAFNSADTLVFPPASLSLRWFDAYLTDPAWHAASWHSLVVAAMAAFIATILGSGAALALVRGRLPFAGALRGLFLLPIIVPTIVTAIASYRLFADLGLAGTVLGLAIAHGVLGLPFVVLNVAAALRKADTRIEHAARSLGATPVRAFWHVTLPMIAPGVAAGAVFAFVTSFDEVVLAVFLTGIDSTTLPVQMWSGIRFETTPTVAAVSVLLVVLSTACFASFTLLRRRAP